MTNWLPNLENRHNARYLAIADALEKDVSEGRLPPGSRLPTHRDLAWRLGVTVGTVSRAYAEAERRGLVSGEVGRGTYVRDRNLPQEFFGPHDDLSPQVIDLSMSVAAEGLNDAALAKALADMAADPAVGRLATYRSAEGLAHHRAAGAVWVGRRGLDVDPRRVALTCGGNHGILVALAAATQPGDKVLVEPLSYPMIQPIAQLMGRRLEAVATDDEGLRPDALEAACRSGEARALYCIPTMHNPTTAVMPEARRAVLAEVAEAHRLSVIEDEIYAHLLPDAPPPLVSRLPELGYYLASLSKTLGAAGLRVGYLVGPRDTREAVFGAIRASVMMASPVTAEIATRWIESGTADRLLDEMRREMTARRRLAFDILRPWNPICPEGGLHIWLPLPEERSADEVAGEARQRGVIVAPGAVFARDGRSAPNALRLSLGKPRDRAQLESALTILARVLSEEHRGLMQAIV